MSAAALETVGLEKRFGAIVVAEGIDFRLHPGERHALIGPNGAGKTTFVNLVTGRLAPSAGRVLLGGEDVTRRAPLERVKRGLARTFQINTQFMGLSVLENVRLAIFEREGLAWRMFAPAEGYRAVADEALAILEDLRLAALAHRRVDELAYGEQRMLEVALALASRPSVLLLDEPSAGVPAEGSQAILDQLARLPAQIAVMIIEHDMDLVFRFAQRVTVLDQGRVVATGTPAEVQADAHVRAIYFGERPHG
ncbi:MAG: ABC transporter ATP-binding protein [Betaproteobacteria bacterium]